MRWYDIAVSPFFCFKRKNVRTEVLHCYWTEFLHSFTWHIASFQVSLTKDFNTFTCIGKDTKGKGVPHEAIKVNKTKHC